MTEAEVIQFLTHLAVKEKVSASMQNQPLATWRTFMATWAAELPLDREYPNASNGLACQFVFPQLKRWFDSKTREQGRHHVDESSIQKAIKTSVRAAGRQACNIASSPSKS